MLALALFALAGTTAADTSLEGVWRSPGGNTIMKIATCGDSPCGTVAWASDKAKKDSAKATDQLVGTALLTALKQDKKGHWQGKLFIPDQKMHATAKIERISADQLKVSGCAAGKMLCKSQVWTAFSGPLPTDTSVPVPK
jgi:uncharacterized protein (DUF2147 family)